MLNNHLQCPDREKYQELQISCSFYAVFLQRCQTFKIKSIKSTDFFFFFYWLICKDSMILKSKTHLQCLSVVHNSEFFCQVFVYPLAAHTSYDVLDL